MYDRKWLQHISEKESWSTVNVHLGEEPQFFLSLWIVIVSYHTYRSLYRMEMKSYNLQLLLYFFFFTTVGQLNRTLSVNSMDSAILHISCTNRCTSRRAFLFSGQYHYFTLYTTSCTEDKGSSTLCNRSAFSRTADSNYTTENSHYTVNEKHPIVQNMYMSVYILHVLIKCTVISVTNWTAFCSAAGYCTYNERFLTVQKISGSLQYLIWTLMCSNIEFGCITYIFRHYKCLFIRAVL